MDELERFTWQELISIRSPSAKDAAISLTLNGGNDERVHAEDLTSIIEDFLALAALRKKSKTKAKNRPDIAIDDNAHFWEGAHRFHEGATVLLNDFAVTEWAPAAPGRYFTPSAADARHTAANFLSRSGPEYLPLGKMNMVLGGVGSVRLASVRSGWTSNYYLGATSNGISHQGIPLRLNRDIYGELIPLIKENGACDCRIIGEVELLPEIIRSFDFDQRIPRYIVQVKDIAIINPARQRTTRVSLSVLFLGAARGYERSSKHAHDIGWSFANFDPRGRAGDLTLSRAVDWLSDYAARHSTFKEPYIVCDFDQHVRHFRDNVLFKIEEITKSGLDISLMQRFIDRQGLSIHIGDRFENISNSTIINRSIVSG